MAEPLATVDDLMLMLGVPSTSFDVVRARLVLELASATVRGAAGRPVAWTGDSAGEAKSIVLELAGRLYSNPSGLASETVGPFARTNTVGLTDDERARVAVMRPTRGLHTITLTRDTAELVDWTPVANSDKPLPL